MAEDQLAKEEGSTEAVSTLIMDVSAALNHRMVVIDGIVGGVTSNSAGGGYAGAAAEAFKMVNAEVKESVKNITDYLREVAEDVKAIGGKTVVIEQEQRRLMEGTMNAAPGKSYKL